MKHLRKFDSVADLNAAIASSEIGILGLAYNGSTPVMKIKQGSSPVPPTPTETRLIVTYNVTSTSEPTMLYPDFLEEDEIAMPFTAMEIDGVQYNNIGYSDCFFTALGEFAFILLFSCFFGILFELPFRMLIIDYNHPNYEIDLSLYSKMN
jgi:hypothetical protein